MVNIFSAQMVFKIPLVLLAFAITLKGINTLRGLSKDNQDMSSIVQRENYPDIKLIHKMLTDNLLTIIGINNRWKDITLFSKTFLQCFFFFNLNFY